MNLSIVTQTCKECGQAIAKGLGILSAIMGVLAILSAVLYGLVHYAWPEFLAPLWQTYKNWVTSAGGIPGATICVLTGVFFVWLVCVAHERTAR